MYLGVRVRLRVRVRVRFRVRIKPENSHHNTRNLTSNTHNTRASCYHHRRHLLTLAPSHFILKVGVGFVNEQ